jgi:hypothetical protein
MSVESFFSVLTQFINAVARAQVENAEAEAQRAREARRSASSNALLANRGSTSATATADGAANPMNNPSMNNTPKGSRAQLSGSFSARLLPVAEGSRDNSPAATGSTERDGKADI